MINKQIKRIILVDELRGFAVICMVIFHLLYSLIFIFKVDLGMSVQQAMFFAQPFGAGLFIIISGFSCFYSKSNFKRGFLILIMGLILSAFTYLIIPSQTIIFGILHFLGLSILLFEVTRALIAKVHPWIIMAFSVVIFAVTFNISSGWLNFPLIGRALIPQQFYNYTILAPFGLPPASFSSADYFPLLPWYALFLIGTLIGRYSSKNRWPVFVYQKHIPFLSSVSKYALYIYLAHQPIIFALLWLTMKIFQLQ